MMLTRISVTDATQAPNEDENVRRVLLDRIVEEAHAEHEAGAGRHRQVEEPRVGKVKVKYAIVQAYNKENRIDRILRVYSSFNGARR